MLAVHGPSNHGRACGSIGSTERLAFGIFREARITVTLIFLSKLQVYLMSNLLREVTVLYCMTCTVRIIDIYSVEKKSQNKCQLF